MRGHGTKLASWFGSRYEGNVMKENITELENENRLNPAYEVSDEALESAAIVSGTIKNYTLTFCSTPWTCPMSPQRN